MIKSDRSITWAYKLKASKLSSQIAATNWFKNIAYAIQQNTQEFKLSSIFKHSPNGKNMTYGCNGMKPQSIRRYGAIGICPMVYIAQWKRHGFIKDSLSKW